MIARSTFSRGTLVGCAVYFRGSFCVTSLCVGVNANVRSLQIIGGIMCVKMQRFFWLVGRGFLRRRRCWFK